MGIIIMFLRNKDINIKYILKISIFLECIINLGRREYFLSLICIRV